MRKLQKIDPTNVSVLSDILSDDVLDQLIKSRQIKKDRQVKIGNDLQWFVDGVKERGYSSTDEFLSLTGVVKTETKKKRTRIESTIRTSVIERLKVGKTVGEIVTEFGVTPDTVYSIRSTNGLSTKRKTKVTTILPTLLEKVG